MKRSLFAVYATGTVSFSVILLYIDPPLIAGVDAGGVTYSGEIKYDEMENSYDVSLAMSAPAGTPLISGHMIGEYNQTAIPLYLRLPSTFANGEIIRLELAVGPVNVRFEKIKDLPL